MTSIKYLFIFINLVVFTVFAEQPDSNGNIKLYTLNCGTLDVLDMKDLSIGDEYQGQKTELVNPCFLIRHPKGDLLWDTGHIDSLADTADGNLSGVWHSKLATKLIPQLKQLGITPTDIDYLSLSHIHPDHAGNANKFSDSTFIVNKLEQEYMFTEQTYSMFGANYSALKNSNTITFETQYDVFNDETVVIKSMPGHTPGSSVLLIKLNNSGSILLSGDLYIHQQGRELSTMFKYNVDKNLAVNSRVEFENLAKKENARVIIQHEKQHFDNLPKFPNFLD